MVSSLAVQTLCDAESTPVLLHGSVAVSLLPTDVVQCILMHVDTRWL